MESKRDEETWGIEWEGPMSIQQEFQDWIKRTAKRQVVLEKGGWDFSQLIKMNPKILEAQVPSEYKWIYSPTQSGKIAEYQKAEWEIFKASKGIYSQNRERLGKRPIVGDERCVAGHEHSSVALRGALGDWMGCVLGRDC